MIALHDLVIFALAALVLALTPGPNMAYLMSRTICQGQRAGVVSLAGTTLGFTVHMLASACGLSAGCRRLRLMRREACQIVSRSL